MGQVIRACDVARAKKDLDVAALEERVKRLEKELKALKKAFVENAAKPLVEVQQAEPRVTEPAFEWKDSTPLEGKK